MIQNRDFSLTIYTELLKCLQAQGYAFKTMEEYGNNPSGKLVILRHDVDKRPRNSLYTARIENSLGIRGTYYFRIVSQSNYPPVITEIVTFGHEVGYHYEDLSLSAGDKEKAYKAFIRNLEYFRTFYPVKTICMHGSPTSGFDNRELWKYYSYKDHGISAEPYFDLDFSKVLYLTDTGRKWNGEKTSVRDKVRKDSFPELKSRIKSTRDIMVTAIRNELPEQIMITVHPQRWTNDTLLWIKEFTAQSVKNIIKQMFFVK